MAANTASATVVGQAYGYSTLNGYTTYNPAYAGFGSNNRYAFVLQFITPEFIGASESIAVDMVMGIGVGENVDLRYAICTSDANITSYMGTTATVNDENQVASGTLTIEGLTAVLEKETLTINTSALKPSTTYYLILWGAGDTGVEIRQVNSEWGDHSVSMGYNTGLVYIDNGSGLEAYQAYIDNGTGWDLCIPHIDNGTGWDVYS